MHHFKMEDNASPITHMVDMEEESSENAWRFAIINSMPIVEVIGEMLCMIFIKIKLQRIKNLKDGIHINMLKSSDLMDATKMLQEEIFQRFYLGTQLQFGA